MKNTFLLLFSLILVTAPLAAQKVTVTSPIGSEPWVLGSAHNITWTPENAGSIKVNIILRDSGGKVGVIKSQVALAAGSWSWASVGTLEDGTAVAPKAGYIVRIRNAEGTVSDDSNPFQISAKHPFRMPISPALLRGIRVYMPMKDWVFEAGKPLPIMWDRSGIQSYDKVYFYVMRPDGMIGWRDQVFATAPNTANMLASRDILCKSGNCGYYSITIPKEDILPSPNNRYYVYMFTQYRHDEGKSEMFYWK